MKNVLYYEILKKCRLFQGVEAEDLPKVLSCLSAQTKAFKKGEVLYHEGENIEVIGIVLRGEVHIAREDYWGNQDLLASITPCDMFGETYACMAIPLQVHITAVEETEVLFLAVAGLLTPGPSAACPAHAVVVRNLLHVMAAKNLYMTRKIHIVTQRSIRSKLMAYLSYEAQKAGSSSFAIGLNRQQLADYLGADRSSMTVELGKLCREGVIQMEKNRFTLL